VLPEQGHFHVQLDNGDKDITVKPENLEEL